MRKFIIIAVGLFCLGFTGCSTQTSPVSVNNNSGLKTGEVYDGLDWAYSFYNDRTNPSNLRYQPDILRDNSWLQEGNSYLYPTGYYANAIYLRMSSSINTNGIIVLSYSIGEQMFYDIGKINKSDGGRVTWYKTHIYHGDGNMPNVSINDYNDIVIAMYNHTHDIYVKYGTIAPDYSINFGQVRYTGGQNNAEPVIAINNYRKVVMVYRLWNSQKTYQNVGQYNPTSNSITWSQSCAYFCEAYKINGISLNDYGQCGFLMIQYSPANYMVWWTGTITNGALAWKKSGRINDIIANVYNANIAVQNANFGKVIITTPLGHALLQTKQDYSLNLLSIKALSNPALPLCMAY